MRKERRSKSNTPTTNTLRRDSLELKKIKPLTDNQEKSFDAYKHGRHLLLSGYAGTGKTFIGLGLALQSVYDQQYDKIYIVRSAVQTRDMGHMPGNLKEKSAVYEDPYRLICGELFGRGDAYDILKTKKAINFITTSFIRGVTLDNCVVVVDETQNLNFHEIASIITRVGKNCRIILCGDFFQSDLKGDDKNGIKKAIEIFKMMHLVEFVQFGVDDIVRSEFVKSWIINERKYNLGDQRA
jgi:phosphate starvation-inducible protein PhoH